MEKKLSRLGFLIKSGTLVKKIRNVICRKRPINFDGTYETMNRIAREQCCFNYKYDCEHPRTFNEKIAWLKFNYRNELWCQCADKLGSKKFLEEQGLGQYVVKTYGIYNSSSEINLDELPNDFVLKTNHDCGSVFVCQKGKTDFENVFKRLDEAVKKKYSSRNGEWVYENIEPKIFAEELLKPTQDADLIDYKLFFFNGYFGWGYVAQNRFVDIRFLVFEKNYEEQDVCYLHLKPKQKAKKPEHYDEMIKIGEELSKILDCVRVDFYETTEGLKIGELTFFSHSGLGLFSKKEYDLKYGALFDNCRLAEKFPK